ncbi:hypothetical protein [Micromonospora sp. WMMD736]|uniref:hypothetical protein n=1 Tax=Micromonospora sp. WMMD736 TaxID=3404112 RepID=UPI003B92ACB1
MTEEPFAVRPRELRTEAGALDDEAYQLAWGLARVSGLLVPAPGWRTAAALARLEAAGHAWFCRLGAAVAVTADGVRVAAEAYETVDDRAADRFVTVPR